MIQSIINAGHFEMLYNTNTNLITYVFNGGASCGIWPNESDSLHAANLGLTSIEHKLLHELTHHYVAKALGYSYCPIVYAEAHKVAYPENAAYLEEIIFAVVYFCCEREMLFNNWFGYLDRLYKKVNIFALRKDILNKFSSIKTGKMIVVL